MDKQNLQSQLEDWVNLKSLNGIRQHEAEWYKSKVNTIGGSSIAVFDGKSPFTSFQKLISEKIGLSKFDSNIYPQWGNLFEDVIKRCVEHARDCIVLGEDLYLEGYAGFDGLAYSPDGLAVITVDDEPKIALLEFKCPFSRLPAKSAKSAPKYYVSQVKMGLQMIDIADTGFLIEGVYRRCTWSDLGYNPTYDLELSPKSVGKLPLAYGILGFYCKDATLPLALSRAYNSYYDPSECNDLGEAPVDLFKQIMHAYDKKIITPWYGRIVYTDDDPNDANDIIDADLAVFTKFCNISGYVCLGILPWKLFHLEYTRIERVEGYLEPLIPKITEVLDIVKRCNDPDNAHIKLNIYGSYLEDIYGCFSDCEVL